MVSFSVPKVSDVTSMSRVKYIKIKIGNLLSFLTSACPQVNAECITLCVIDDCLDSDVPLLEVSLSELQVEQVRHSHSSPHQT